MSNIDDFSPADIAERMAAALYSGLAIELAPTRYSNRCTLRLHDYIARLTDDDAVSRAIAGLAAGQPTREDIVLVQATIREAVQRECEADAFCYADTCKRDNAAEDAYIRSEDC